MRWQVLVALTLARTLMGYQFQAVAAVGPGLREAEGLGHGAFGLLLGVYLLPGILIALPGGALGRWFGAARLVQAGVVLMLAGAVLMGAGFLWEGRILSGIGAVFLNVLATKLVADWFQGPDLPMAMGLLITSWPLGLGLAMVTLPAIAGMAGVTVALNAVSLVAAVALALALFFVRDAGGEGAQAGTRVTGGEVVRACIAGLVWTLYNLGLILVLAFAADLLAGRGQDPVGAAALVSLVGWLIIPSLAAGGWLQTRIADPDRTTVVCLLAAAVAVLGLSFGAPAALCLLVIGICLGPPGPLIMTLPASVLAPASLSVGFGIYFTWYYVGMAAAPPLAGALRDATGLAASPLWVSAGCLVGACGALFALRRSAR